MVLVPGGAGPGLLKLHIQILGEGWKDASFTAIGETRTPLLRCQEETYHRNMRLLEVPLTPSHYCAILRLRRLRYFTAEIG